MPDCECCGDRWYRADDYDEPTVDSVEAILEYASYGYVHYLDGRVVNLEVKS